MRHRLELADLSGDLSESIHRLYKVFERYPARRDMPHCECCVSPEEIALICSKPLQELTGDDLAAYAGKAITTWGDVEDFKHFLPRLMEVVATEGSVDWRYPEVVFSRFRYGHLEGWAPSERLAVEAYFLSLWRFVLSRYPVFPGGDDPWSSIVNDYLGAIAQATDDLSPYLQIWRMDRSIPALGHLADFVWDTLDYMQDHGTLGAFWEDRVAEAQVKDWLTDLATQRRLEEGLASPSSGLFVPSLLRALNCLARL